MGEDFRADVGFMPQVGYREGELFAGYNFWAEGFLRRIQPYVDAGYAVDRDGEVVEQEVAPSLLLLGGRNLVGDVGLRFERVRAGNRALPRTQVGFLVQVDPGRRVPRLTLVGSLGEEVDFEHARVGRGASITLNATVRPWDRLSLEAALAQRWLDVEPSPAASSKRLFTARVQRLKATYSFSARAFLRFIGQYVSTDNEPSLFARPVAAREGAFSGSALFSYRLNWQTALFVGYGDERGLDPFEDLARTDRQLFVKISYAWLR